MASKIAAAVAAVEPGSTCSACVVASGANLNSIRAVLGNNPKFKHNVGTLFVTPGSALEAQAMKDFVQGAVSRILVAGQSRILHVMAFSL